MMLRLRTKLKSLFLIAFLAAIYTTTSAQIHVRAERPNTRYELGDTANFRVTGAANGTVSYQIKYTLIDTLPLRARGTAQVVNGVANIPYFATEPVYLTCKVTQNQDTVYAGASFSVEKLQPLEAEPTDFDAFWTTQKTAVRAVPMDAHVTYIRTSTYANVFSFDIAITEGKRTYGYLVVPIGVSPTYPAMILMPSYGAIANVVNDDAAIAERAGVISVFLSPHNNPPNVAASVDDYLVVGLANPQNYYIKSIILGTIKTIDYLQTRPDFNGQVGAMGISQGGALSALVAGIDTRISLLACAYPSFCHQAAAKYFKPACFPYAYNTAYSQAVTRENILSTVKYYDPVYALKRFKGVSYNVTSLKDFVCPPQPVTTAFNQIKGQKITECMFNNQHIEGPDEFFNSSIKNSIYAFFRRHFPICRRAPWPFNPTTTGYVIEAGKDTVLVKNVLKLAGFVGLNDTATTLFPVKWQKISGLGNVVFVDSTNRNTTATFSKIGEYRLRLYAYDYTQIVDNKYFVLSNDIVVTVDSIPTNAVLTPSDLADIQLFPNPADNELTVRINNNNDSDIKIYDVLGRIQLLQTTKTAETTLSINHLEMGLYSIQIKNGASIITKHFIKK